MRDLDVIFLGLKHFAPMLRDAECFQEYEEMRAVIEKVERARTTLKNKNTTS